MKISKNIIVFILCIFVLFGIMKSFNIQSNASNDIPNIQISNDDNGTIEKGLEENNKKKVLNKILGEYRKIVTFVSAIGTLSMILFFILNFIALGNSKGNPQERQKAITGLIVSGIATAGLGSVVMITTLFYNMLQIDNT